MRFLALALLIPGLAVSPVATRNDVSADAAPVQALPAGPAPRAPERITLTWMTWGQVREVWVISDGGQVRWSDGGHQEKTFTITSADFARVREGLRPYEARDFSCERIVPDMPYGHIVWSSDGPDHRVGFDRGCTGGDADDLLQRLDEIRSVLTSLRDQP